MRRRAPIRILDLPARHRRARGFALLEVLVAFVILALGLAAISTGVAVAMRSDARIQTSRVALRFAQSRLEAAGIDGMLLPGQRSGRIGDRYKWQETVTTVQIGGKSPELLATKAGQPAPNDGILPYWVEIEVIAADGIIARLSALKLAPGARP
jgi:type II secretory pathway pseudopilin PulG